MSPDSEASVNGGAVIDVPNHERRRVSQSKPRLTFAVVNAKNESRNSVRVFWDLILGLR